LTTFLTALFQICSLYLWDEYIDSHGEKEVFARFWKSRQTLFEDGSTEDSRGQSLSGVFDMMQGFLLGPEDMHPSDLLEIDLPLFIIQGTEDVFVDPRHASIFQPDHLPPGSERVVVDNLSEALKPHALHVAWLRSGHEVLQERQPYMLAVISRLVQMMGVAPGEKPPLPPGMESDGTDIDDEFDPVAQEAKRERRKKRAQDKLDLASLDILRREEAKIQAMREAEEAAARREAEEVERLRIMELDRLKAEAEAKKLKADRASKAKEDAERKQKELEHRQHMLVKAKEERARLKEERKRRELEMARESEMARLREEQRKLREHRARHAEMDLMREEERLTQAHDAWLEEQKRLEAERHWKWINSPEYLAFQQEEQLRLGEERNDRERVARMHARIHKTDKMKHEIQGFEDYLDGEYAACVVEVAGGTEQDKVQARQMAAAKHAQDRLDAAKKLIEDDKARNQALLDAEEERKKKGTLGRISGLWGRGRKGGSEVGSDSDNEGGGVSAGSRLRGAVGKMFGRMASRSPSPSGRDNGAGTSIVTTTTGDTDADAATADAGAGKTSIMKRMSSSMSIGNKLKAWSSKARARSSSQGRSDSEAEMEVTVAVAAVGDEPLQITSGEGEGKDGDGAATATAADAATAGGAGGNEGKDDKSRVSTLASVKEEEDVPNTPDRRERGTGGTLSVETDTPRVEEKGGGVKGEGEDGNPSFYRRFTSSVRQTFTEAFKPHQLAGGDWDDERTGSPPTTPDGSDNRGRSPNRRGRARSSAESPSRLSFSGMYGMAMSGLRKIREVLTRSPSPDKVRQMRAGQQAAELEEAQEAWENNERKRQAAMAEALAKDREMNFGTYRDRIRPEMVMAQTIACHARFYEFIEWRRKCVEAKLRLGMVQRKTNLHLKTERAAFLDKRRMERAIDIVKMNPSLIGVKKGHDPEREMGELYGALARKASRYAYCHSLTASYELQRTRLLEVVAGLEAEVAASDVRLEKQLKKMMNLENKIAKTIRELKMDREQLVINKDRHLVGITANKQREELLNNERRRIKTHTSEFVDTVVYMEGVLQRCITLELREQLKRDLKVRQ
jgi:hypothetical protein